VTIAFEANHAFHKAAKDRRAVSGACTNDQRPVRLAWLRQLDETRQHHGLHQPAPASQRYAFVGVRHRRPIRRQEPFARQCRKRVQQARMHDLVRAQLAIHHVAACNSEVGRHVRSSIKAGMVASRPPR
jgi:hypothetical protein